MDFEALRDLIVETVGCDPEQVTPEVKLGEGGLEADSLTAVELVMALEEATGLTIDEGEAEKFQTVGDIIDYLAAHKG